MNDHAKLGTIHFEHVSKRYRLGTLGSLRGAISTLFSRDKEHDEWQRVLWALRDVSFGVEPGGSVGLIGPNGAGKTTTLKLLSNITRPTSGRIAVSGRVSSLIELGAGFHPELTGRENIYLNGAILGLTRREIAQRMDLIIAFSELERFIDTPVKRYSSGMYVRLAFAVAAHVEPDILLVDEVLAVGDASFRHRCIEHMQSLRRNGTTVLFVSHSMHLVRSMCERVLLLHNGQVCAEGEPSAVIGEYERLILGGDVGQTGKWTPGDSSHFHDSKLVIGAIEVLPSAPGGPLSSEMKAQLRIPYRSHGPQPIGRIAIRIVRQDGTLCCVIDSAGEERLTTLAASGDIVVLLDPLQLTGGVYRAEVNISDPSDSIVVGSGYSESFVVVSSQTTPEPGVYLPNVTWQVAEDDSE